MKTQHRKISVNIVLHMDHSQVHNSVGSVAKAALPTEIIMVGQHFRMMITTTGHRVDHLTHDTVRATSRNVSYRGNGNSRGYYQSESYSEPEPE